MTGRRRMVAAIALTLSVAACTPAAAHHTSGGTGGTAAAPATPAAAGADIATRWWSNDAVQVGSVIDPNDPDAAAAKLSPSRTQYCGMLSQTLTAGHSVLPNAGVSDPALLNSTAAFLAELQKVAPSAVSHDWTLLAQAVEALVNATGAKAVNAKAVAQAATAVAADAKTNCHLDLSAPAK
jgi:hypothetical protein